MIKATRVALSLGDSEISIETGKIARQADGAVLVQQGETIVFVAAVCSKTVSDRFDFFPLTCDYRERTYANGKIPGGFFKREGRPTEKETLTARLMDRPIRPLFPKGFFNELQIMASVLQSGGDYDPDVLAVLGASCALRISNIPFADALGVVRVGYVEGKYVVNPTYEVLKQSSIDVVLAGTQHGITMIEGSFKEVPEQQLVEAVTFGYDELKKTIAVQEDLVSKIGKPKREDIEVKQPSEELIDKVRSLSVEQFKEINQPKAKHDRRKSLSELLASITEQLKSADETLEDKGISAAFEKIEREQTRKIILERKSRADGRKYDQLRDISCEVSILPRTHGSALFTRGETQSLSVTTLGTSRDQQIVESYEGESKKRFMLHYNFPPFSVGETRPVRGPGRREIGHGALAERSLEPMLPPLEEFPYTVRVVSDIMESNGSSSMATVCAGTLSLMDAGVAIKAPVSGIAMGLIKEGDQSAILTDISGLEDHIGDMDFKVTGTRLGTTALQLDVKLREGLGVALITKILEQANPARIQILDLMAKAIDKPRAEISEYAPRITTLKINPDKIRDVIGPGGRMIRKIIEETGTAIDIENDGTVSISSTDGKKAEKAVEIIKSLTEDVEVGKVYNAKVKRIMNFGAFCEYLPGKEGLVRVSELDVKFVEKVEDFIKIGDEFKVKVIEVDEQGRVNLSRKRALKP